MPNLLYIRGTPGSGKHTVAKLLEQRLGWTLFWQHDLDAICKIVGSHPGDCSLARVMDEVTAPILRHLLSEDRNVIYVRPSRDEQTVWNVRRMLAYEHNFTLVRLEASYETLVRRVEQRAATDYRISTTSQLRQYMTDRPMGLIPGEHVIDTDDLTPEQVADEVLRIIGGGK